ncbi:TIGR02679 family protein [Nocardiopsis sp. NPDC058631]|uniref:TIGR02679 family protein n=1 Tax=Nocardiopsis sp. NPDC058631 TaxID=3346566 RepID=UPI003659199A
MDLTGPDLPRLRRLLGGPGTARLLARLRRRMEDGTPLTGTLTLSRVGEGERAAVESLLGRRPGTGTSLSVPLDTLDTVLRSSAASPDGLAAAVILLTGPVRSRREADDERERAWAAALAPLEQVCETNGALARWCARVRSDGRIRRLTADNDDAARLVRTVARAVAALPAEGVALSEFAARTLGDAHALDDDRPATGLVLGAARALTDQPEGGGAAWRRRVWAAVGVLKDELSSTVLALNLPGDPATATGRALAALGEAGQPAVLTLRQLAGEPAHTRWSGTTVSVCENPAVVAAAADRLGERCAPLVCLQGQPSAAALALLRQAVGGGARLRVHGDFDWGGVRIATGLARHVAWQPWRFGAADYRAAVSGRGRPLTGTPAPTGWDPGLAGLMEQHGRRVEEETVVGELLADLARD